MRLGVRVEDVSINGEELIQVVFCRKCRGLGEILFLYDLTF